MINKVDLPSADVARVSKQIEDILKQVESGPARVKIGLARGETVRITEGPFVDFIGSVNDVDDAKGKVRVLVSFFGRETPVELDFLQHYLLRNLV